MKIDILIRDTFIQLKVGKKLLVEFNGWYSKKGYFEIPFEVEQYLDRLHICSYKLSKNIQKGRTALYV